MGACTHRPTLYERRHTRTHTPSHTPPPITTTTNERHPTNQRTNDNQVGVLSELPDTIVRTKARLEPGKMFLVDFEKGDIIPDSGACRHLNVCCVMIRALALDPPRGIMGGQSM